MPREIMYAQAINEAMAEEMKRDSRVFTMGENLRGRRVRWEGGTQLDKLFNDRVLNTPISEPGFIGLYRFLNKIEKNSFANR